jgi:tellurite resistance protein
MATFKNRHGAYVKHGGAKSVKASQGQWDALVETMVIATCIDGILSPGESEALAALILDTPGFESLDNKALARVVERVASNIASDGLDARVKSIAKALEDDEPLREQAFMLATLFVHWDGEVGEEEQEYLNSLQDALRINDERASHIDSVLAEWSEKTNAS